MKPFLSTSIDPNQGLGIDRTSENARESLAWCIETARNQDCFYDSARQGPEDFMASLAHCRLAQQELFCTTSWLVSLLPASASDATVRSGFKRWRDELGRSSSDVTSEGVRVLGQCKRDLLALCLALEADARPSTVAAACRELREAFRMAEIQCGSMTRSVAAALGAVRAQDAPLRPVATPVLQARSAAPKRSIGDVPEDRFTGLAPRKRDTESFDTFLARNRGAAIGQLTNALDVLARKAKDAGVEEDFAARALAPCRASASAMASQGASGTDDEVLSLGLKLYALDQLFSRLDSPHGDPSTKQAAVARLMVGWASSSLSSRAQVAVLFQTLRDLDKRLAGSDPLSCAFLGERARLMADALAQVVAGLDDEGDAYRGRTDLIAAAHEQLSQLLGLPQSAPISDRAELDATTLTRVFFGAMPAWRDGAVIARLADRQMRVVIRAVEDRLRARWEALDVNAALGALAELSSLASGHDRGWRLPMMDSAFCHAPGKGEMRLHRDANPLGLHWTNLLRLGGLAHAAMDRIGSWPDGVHPALPGPGAVFHVQGALCAINVGGRWRTLGPWVADQMATSFTTDRLRRVVIEAVEAAEPGASHRLSRWTIGADGAIALAGPTRSLAKLPPVAPATPAATASPTRASVAAAAAAEAASVDARGATASSSPPAFEADAFLARLLSVVERLRDHVVDAGRPEAGLNSLLARVAGQHPNGGEDDEVGMLHLLGVDGLNRICDALDRIAPGEPSMDWPLHYLLDFLKGPSSTMGILNVALQLSPILWGQKDAKKMHDARKDFLRHELSQRALALPEQERRAAVSGAGATVRQLLGWEVFSLLSPQQRAEAARLVDLSAPGLFALHQAAEAAARQKIEARRAR